MFGNQVPRTILRGKKPIDASNVALNDMSLQFNTEWIWLHSPHEREETSCGFPIANSMKLIFSSIYIYIYKIHILYMDSKINVHKY